MLGRSAGISEAQLASLADDPLPDGVFEPPEAAIVRYAQRSTRTLVIDDATYAGLERHFSTRQIMDICFTVGISNLVNRFHATFRTDLDQDTIDEVEAGDAAAGACAIPRPPVPR